MPLKWRSCEWRDGFEGGVGSHPFCLVYQHTTGGFGDGQWIWSMNGMPHNAKVPLLGFADTADEAKQSASEVFDVWLERSGLMIAPPAQTPAGLSST
jgi:hypothetical protein